jgi:predicted metal-dependent hydrolase
MTEPHGYILEWARLFNAGDYFEAHEALESEWLAASEPQKTFLKGLIHAAVALHHYRRGNGHGARVKSRSALGYLATYPDTYLRIEVQALRLDLTRFFAGLNGDPAAVPMWDGETAWPRVALQEWPTGS